MPYVLSKGQSSGSRELIICRVLPLHPPVRALPVVALEGVNDLALPQAAGLVIDQIQDPIGVPHPVVFQVPPRPPVLPPPSLTRMVV